MKRTILASIIGIAAVVAVNSAQAQGKVNLDNYSNTGQIVSYGSGPSAIGGTTAGAGVYNGTAYNGVAGNVTWTVGLYWALGSVTVAADPSGTADPATLGALTYLTTASGGTAADGGAGANTTFNETGDHGTFVTSTGDALLNGYSSGSATFVVVAFSGSSYDTSTYRGHSAGFTLTPATGSSSAPTIGSSSGGMPAFGVYATPEPSILALSGIGAAALMLFRRKK